MIDAVATLSAEDATEDFDPFASGLIERVVSTTEAQREVWLGDRLSPEASLAYNETLRLRLKGTLDTRALASALDRLVGRHESLRATISPDGTQLLIGEAAPVHMAEHDLGALDAAAQKRRLEEDGVAAVLEPFQLEQGPLFRAALYRLSPIDHVLVMSAHHAVCDGWSWGVISQDLGSLYAEQIGAGPALEPAAQYSDYAAWEAQEANSPEMDAHVGYWLSRFAGGSLPVLELPLDRPRPAVRTFNAYRIDHVLSQDLIDGLRKVGAVSGTSLFATMFGAFAATLHRLTAQDDLVIGIAAAGQMPSDMPSLVGHCVNLLPIRVAVDAQARFDALARQSGSALLDAFEHQTLTYGALLKKLPVPRDPSRLPLVNVLFNVDRDAAPNEGNFPDLQVEQSTIARRYENFELFLNVTPVVGGMQMEAQYNADLYDDATVRRWLGMYESLLRAVVRDPTRPVGRLELLSPAEAHALAALQPAPTPLEGAPLMHAGFMTHAATQPAQPALRDGAQRMSYRELDERSNQLAHALRARGMGRGERVGLCLDRGFDMFVALLAVLKSGAAYVPLDPAFPQARLDYYAEDAKLGLLLTSSSIAAAPKMWREDAADRVLLLNLDTSWQNEAPTPLVPGAQDAQGEDTAYVIYTSGSTGKPKGVCVPHRAAANLMQTMQREPGIGASDRMAAVTTLSFDMAVPEVMLPLAAGAEIVIVQREVAMDGNRLRALLESEAITILQATPGMWRLLLDAEWSGPRGFRAWIGAEPVPADLSLELMGRTSELWNLYGPTETTVWSTVWRMERPIVAARGVSIGRPMANTGVWILDSNLQPCPVGVPGEICISGMGVTLGYLDRPELTAERFVTTAIDGVDTLIYRSGDRGRWRNDGLLEHLGRFDFQVKVRGYRIELGEIEARCNEAPGVARSVVVTREDQPGDVRLVAYLAASPGATVDLAALDRHLRSRLPQYMVPQHVVGLDAIPLLPNGKVDRKALPKPSATRQETSERLAPRNERERIVMETMERVLNLPGLGIRDDFFSLGGHSLLAARLATLLSREFELTVPLRMLFEAPTAERLAAAIEGLDGSNAPRSAPIAHVADRRSAPLTPMQERIRFVEELHPGRSTYNAPSAHRLGGPLDIEKFKAALRVMIERQPSLRTAVGADPATGAPAALIAKELAYELPVIDLGHLPEDQREAELVERMHEMADQPIDIHRAPMFHAALYKIAADDHAFVFVPHHLIWDGWSFDILQSELSAIYGALVRGEAHGLPELAVTHGDYADWYARWLTEPEAELQLRYWKDRFANSPTPKAPRTDMPRRAGMSGQGGAHWINVDKALTERLRETGQRHDVTLNMLTLGVYILMMSSIIDSRSIVIATPVRGREAPELEPVMGFFNNVLPLSFQIDRSLRFGEFMRYVKQELIAVMSHQQIPFERLVSEPEFVERAQGVGLYQALFSFQDARERPRDIGGLQHRQMHLPQRGATDDLGIWLMDKPDGLEGAVVYNADIYKRETGAAFKERYLELLRLVAQQPDATLEAIAAPAGSDSASYLQRLAADAAPAPTAAQTVAARPRQAQPQVLLLPEQAKLAQIWASALSIDVNDIHAHDNFFDLGGDSLLAMRVIQQAEQVMGFRVEPRRYVFEGLGQLASAAAGIALDALAAASAEGESRRGGLLGRVFSGWSRKS
ncbi:amino acid adenylation domain-containing protein [Variovorax sp. CF079]|uniref:non-ribosomal peptide synthetase n=1 Tax=Variovorax sp. CF079 TaxID=1882774 RepID=UPI00088B8D21|nr:non-ribosomal peptide synthetase [Variovorax sp. CF079]SDC66757.1 amino acid adenylation domain-containing protein [Variovorax sp. CF079]